MPDNYLLLFFPLAITLHNIEEALWLPQWSKHAGRFHPPVEKHEFHFALIVITAMAYLATFLTVLFPDNIYVTRMFYGFLGAMIINAIFPHLVATIVLKKYAPGLLTGLFLIIPVNSILIYRAVMIELISIIEIVITTIALGAIFILAIPLLFKAGRYLINY
jgi:hypothetical protein